MPPMPPSASVTLPPEKPVSASVPSDIASAIKAGEDLGAKIGKVISISNRHAPYILVRDGNSWKCVETDAALLQRPRSLFRLVKFTSADSFCKYLNEFPTGTTRCYATLPAVTIDLPFEPGNGPVPATTDPFRINAIIDDHADGFPSWCDHHARLELARSKEWAEWLAIHRTPMTQRQFAEFIEDHIGQIVIPDGARMLDIASAINVSTSAAFKSAVRLDNGQVQIQYVETVKDENQDGACKIPQTLGLEMPVFDFCDPVTVTARLRYRICEGKLSLSIILDNAAKIESDIFIEEVCHRVASETKRPLYFGNVNGNVNY